MKLGHFEMPEPVPEMKDPHVLAVLRPWIDVGSVGTLTLSRLERHLRAKEIGRMGQPGLFYDFTRYRPRSFMNEGQREFNVPNTIVLILPLFIVSLFQTLQKTGNSGLILNHITQGFVLLPPPVRFNQALG